MTIIGYARVSTTDQDLSIQEAALKAAGCDVIRAERSGTSTNGRTELQTVLDFIRSGDVLMVTRIDRLARSIGDLQDIVRAVKEKGASLRATEQPIDTSTAAGKCFLDMRVCRVRDEPPARAAARGDRQGQGGRRLQRPQAEDRPRGGREACGRRRRRDADCGAARYQPGLGVSAPWARNCLTMAGRRTAKPTNSPDLSVNQRDQRLVAGNPVTLGGHPARFPASHRPAIYLCVPFCTDSPTPGAQRFAYASRTSPIPHPRPVGKTPRFARLA